MSTGDEIKQLEEQLKRKKSDFAQKQANCKHEFTEPIYDPEKYNEPVFSHYIPRGSDPEAVYNYMEREKHRWSRICIHCEKKEYTFEQKPTGPTKPYFGN